MPFWDQPAPALTDWEEFRRALVLRSNGTARGGCWPPL